MSPILLAQLLLQFGSVGIPLILKLKGDIDAGKTATTVTDADLNELKRLADQSSADIFARMGVLPPA